jgi:hypothetical protein
LRDSLLFIFARKLSCPLVASDAPPVENERLWDDSISIPV